MTVHWTRHCIIGRALVLVALTGLLMVGCDNGKVANTSDSGTDPDGAIQADAAPLADAAPQPDSGADPDGALTDAAVDPDSAVGPDSGPDPDAGAGDLVISWSSSNMWANCMPMVPPDPWNGTLDLVYDNTAGGGPASATVLGVRMVFQAAGNPTLDLVVTPTAVGPVAAGTSTTVTHTKTGATNDIPGDCGYCSTTVVYEVTLDVGGQQVLVTSPAQQVSCAY
jgi:hypothetical protein